MPARPVVVFLNRWPAIFPAAQVRALWADVPAEIRLIHTQDPDEIQAAVQDASALVMAWNRQFIGEPVFAAAPRLRLVQKLSAAYDDVDVAAATERGIVCCQNAGANAPSVAEHVAMVALAQRRRLLDAHASLRSGQWEPMRFMTEGIEEIGGRTIGLVGFGHMGQAIAERLQGFGVQLLAYQRRPIDPALLERHGIRQVPLDDLLRQSDLVSLQVPLTPETRGLLDAERLALLPDGATVINVARGPVVVRAALVAELQRGRLHACLDVFDQEPVEAGDPYLDCPNVVLTPHLAGISAQVRQRTLALGARNLQRLLAGADDFEGRIRL